MKPGYRAGLAAVRASYTPEKAADERENERLAHLVYRPLSFYVTPVFLALGWTADAVCALQVVLAALLPVAAWAGGLAGAGAMVALALTIQVLDCVDGNIARTTGRHSRVGAVLEGFCTLLFWMFYFIAVGVLAEAPGHPLARQGAEIGLALAVMFLAQRSLEDTFSDRCGEHVRWTPPAAQESRWRWVAKVVEHSFAFGGLLVAAALRVEHWFLAGIAAYQGTVFLLWIPRFVRAVAAKSKTQT